MSESENTEVITKEFTVKVLGLTLFRFKKTQKDVTRMPVLTKEVGK